MEPDSVHFLLMLMIHDHGLIAQILETTLLILLHKNPSGTFKWDLLL